MLVSNNSLLNILLPKDNTSLKDVLKQADSSTLEQMVKNKSVNINDILKNLFDDIRNGTKSNHTIENILKNSPIFKDLGSFSNSLSLILEDIDENTNLQKFKPILENMFKNIKDLDASSLKEQLNKSGVFLEAKIAQNINQSDISNTNTQKVLNEIENLIKDTKTPQSQQIKELIQKVIESKDSTQQTINLKNLSNSLYNLSSNLLNLTNQLTKSINEGSLLESKMINDPNNINNNLKNQINIDIKDLLNQIKIELSQNSQNKNTIDILNNLLKVSDLFSQNLNSVNKPLLTTDISNFTSNLSSNLNTLLLSLKENNLNLEFQNNILKSKNTIESIIKESLSNPNTIRNESNSISNDMKSVLLQMQEEISQKTDTKSQEILKQVERLLTQIEYHQLTSLSTNSNYIYLPFFWDMLEDGSIDIKETDDEKFYCQINLTLKDFGKVDLMMSMYDTNKIDLTISAQREHFKIAVRDNLQSLKKALNDINLIPVNIKLLDLKEDSEKTSINKKTEAFVNQYNNQISTIIDIRA